MGALSYVIGIVKICWAAKERKGLKEKAKIMNFSFKFFCDLCVLSRPT